MNAAIPPPTHLEKHTSPFTEGKPLYKFEWRGLLCGGNRFKIKYYGRMLGKETELIVGGEAGPTLVSAEDPATGEEIVLFDGDRHGYNAMIEDESLVSGDRTAKSYYRDSADEDMFSVVISVYNHHYDDDEDWVAEEDGLVTLPDGTRLDVETARRDSFDFLRITVTNAAGRVTTIVEEELA